MEKHTRADRGQRGRTLVGGDLGSQKAFQQATPQCQMAILAYKGTQAAQPGKSLWVLPLSVSLS